MGVTQLVNKKGGKPHPLNECVNEYDYTGRFFTSYDEELAKSFSVYCGISLHHVSHVTDRVTCGHVWPIGYAVQECYHGAVKEPAGNWTDAVSYAGISLSLTLSL